MTTTPTTRAHELAAVRLGRDLTRGETRIDLVRLDRAMASAKERLVAEIERQRRKGYRAVLAGRPFRIERTPEMDAILTELYETGVDAAREEIRAAGYDPDALPRSFTDQVRETTDPVRNFAARELPTTLVPLGRSLDARLAALGRDTQVRILATDLSGLATSAILASFQTIPGARAVAADFISTPLLNGMGDVWGQADAAGIVERWVYSAILDAATCPVCEGLDGDEFDSWEEIQVVLPDGGPNPECDGGDRCRCRAVPELADPTAASGYPAPDTPPPGYDALVGRPAIDDGLAPLATDEGPTVANLVPGPTHDYRLEKVDERDYRVERYLDSPSFRDLGWTPDRMVSYVDEMVADAVRDSEIRMRVKPETLGKILDDGRFKSQFETNTSGGALNQNLRADAERKMFGYEQGEPLSQPPVEPLAPERRPLYGYLSGAKEDEWLDMYGSVMVRFQPSVRARSTFTLDDSLSLRVVPEPVDAPTSLAFDWIHAPPKPGDPVDLPSISGAYPEAQIHGGLAADEIEEVVFPAWSPSSYWESEARSLRFPLDILDAEIAAGRATAEQEAAAADLRQKIAGIERDYLTDPHVALQARLDELGISWRAVTSLDRA